MLSYSQGWNISYENKNLEKNKGKLPALAKVAANKFDLAPNKDLTDVRIWAETKGFKFIASSAATGKGVNGKDFLSHVFLNLPHRNF